MSDQAATQRQEATRPRRSRTVRPFPAGALEESVEFARQIYEFGSGNPVRRLTFFDYIGKSPESGPSRQLIINSNKYGLTKGAYNAEQLELTSEGLTAVSDRSSDRERRRALIKLGVEGVEPFKEIYQKLVNNRLPAKAALIDLAREAGVPSELAEECVDLLIVNLRYLGLAQILSGADRVVTIDHVLDSLPGVAVRELAQEPLARDKSLIPGSEAEFETTCFYVTPIGEIGSEHRKHSDLFLASIVEPALEKFNLNVVRAEQIERPALITKQVIHYLVKSRLVIADLSFHNPNVFYEVAIRHAVRKPIVQLISSKDRIPFDVAQSRTIVIDNTDIYTMVPSLDVYRSQLSTQVRRALDSEEEIENPLSVFYPSFRAVIG